MHSDTRPLLPIHANPDPRCAIGRRVQSVLGEAFQAAEQALEQALGKATLADLLQGVRVEEPALPGYPQAEAPLNRSASFPPAA